MIEKIDSKKLIRHFNIRSGEFDISACWITDRKLISAHVVLAGEPSGEAMDLCCGTGQVGRALRKNGWRVKGLDIAENMIKSASSFFPVFRGKAENIPFESSSFNLVVCRQSFQFLDVKKVLSEISRILILGGSFIMSLTVPFSDKDRRWLYNIHNVKQPLLLKFYTGSELVDELKQAGFIIKKKKTFRVRENINRWMEYAPELTKQTKEKVISMIKNAPLAYRKLHKVEVVNGEVFEDWNWVVLKTVFSKR